MAGEDPKPPIDSSYSAGCRIRGLSAADGDKLMEPYRKRQNEQLVLESEVLVSLALELGFQWDALSIRSGPFALDQREPTAAESLLLQMPPIVQVAFMGEVFGGGLPSLFWSDFGDIMPLDPLNLAADERDQKRRTIYHALHIARTPQAAQTILGEAVDLVLTSESFDKMTYEYSLSSSQIGAIFSKAPRVIITNPQTEFDPGLRHKKIVSFGFSQALYFKSVHLRGVMTHQLWSAESAVSKFSKPAADKRNPLTD